ncbi:MAG: glycosyl hydrolase [Treponema sp.]|nr:glycosyl hydrolase [Treponema sp.]
MKKLSGKNTIGIPILAVLCILLTLACPEGTTDKEFSFAPVLFLTAQKQSITCDWIDSTPEAGWYDVYYVEGNFNDVNVIKAGTKIPNVTTGFTIQGLEAGKYYSFVVVANKSGYHNINSEIKTVQLSEGEDPYLPPVPKAPSLTVSIGNGSLTLTWTNSTPAADSYDIYYTAGNTSNPAEIKEGTKISGASSPRTISGLSNGTTYSLLVTANTGEGSLDSNVKQEMPSATLLHFSSVPELTVNSGNESITLTWTDSTPPADSYEIYYTNVNTTDINTVFYGMNISNASSPRTISGLSNETVYSVVIVAFKAGYSVSFSDIKQGTPSMPVVPSLSQGRSPKRGVSYGFDGSTEGKNTASEDMALLSPGVSWFYTWGNNISNNLADFMIRDNVVFIPMSWGAVGSNQTSITNNIKALKQKNTKIEYILAYNEPMFVKQANLTPAAAAADWPRLKQIAADCDLKIIGPALNYTPDGNVHLQPKEWFASFITQPNVSLSDMHGIALHCYMNYPGSIKGYTADDFRSYGLPIWVTEFCAWDWSYPATSYQSLAWQQKYMAEICTYYEQDPMIRGYAWFIPRGNASGWPYYSLLTGSGTSAQLTDLGKIYVNMSTCDKSVWSPVGSFIPAAHFTANHLSQFAGTSGTKWAESSLGYEDFFGGGTGAGGSVHFRPTTDTDSNAQVLDVYDFTSNKWQEYQVDLPSAKEYTLTLRYKTVNATNMNITIDGGANIPATLNSTAWANSQVNLGSLSAGHHTIRLRVTSGKCELNWLRVD